MFGDAGDVRFLKRRGKKIVYSNNGCLDGVSQTSFGSWGPHRTCDSCKWQHVPAVCSDERNLAWGRLRNELVDYHCTTGSNRIDYNDSSTMHEVPEFYCLDTDFWRPDLEVPSEFKIDLPSSTVRIYHAVGNFESRADLSTSRNIKSTHLYMPVVQQLKDAGHDVEMLFFSGVPNRDVRFYQVQCDIVVDMLTFGFFGANVREALMLGKPVVCFLRPEWLEDMRREVPGYVDELPVVSATPETVYSVLEDLITHPEKRRELGRRGREFAVKWHAADVGARRLEEIYVSLLEGSANADAGSRLSING
jgi:hypothetical protein